jgi:hypothetical protein
MKTYRLYIRFPSGSELSTSVNFLVLKDWLEKEKFGYSILSCNGYKWRNVWNTRQLKSI